MSDVRPVAVLLTPLLPLPGGSGPALRAWDWLTELARTHRVQVLVAGWATTGLPADYPAEAVWPLPRTARRPSRWRRALGWLLPPVCLLQRRTVAEWRRPRGGRMLEQALDRLAEAPVERIVVFRLYLHDLAEVVAQRCPQARLELDMDDLESHTRWSVAGSLWRMGRHAEATRCAATALQYALLERTLQGRYHTLWLAAAEDMERLRTRLAPRCGLRPNRVALPDDEVPSLADGTLRLLFVGTLGYAPNEEAVRDLVCKVLPELERVLRQPWVLCVVGRRAGPELSALLHAAPRVEFLSDVDALSPCYAAAQVVLVPLRAGGGTKLKTLEAFSYRRPVVSTAQGVRGLDVTAGEHYLPAETPAEFAHAIARLADDPVLARRIAEAGHALCARRYARP